MSKDDLDADLDAYKDQVCNLRLQMYSSLSGSKVNLIFIQLNQYIYILQKT